MGGRGASSGVSKGGAPSLDNNLIRRANAASFAVDAGDATKREYTRNVETIKGLGFDENETKAAYKELHRLTTEQLRAESQSVSPYTSGVARFNRAQVQKNAQKAVDKRAAVNSYMNSLKDKAKKAQKQKETNTLSSALKSAMSSGKLEVTVNGKTYYRTRKNSATWRVR